jgi:uncharacterized protein YjbJ (UPF0337 family)
MDEGTNSMTSRSPRMILRDHNPKGRVPVSSTTDKIKGYSNEAAGSAKKAVGKAVGDDSLHAEGSAQKAAGHAQVGVGKAKDAVKKVVDKA